MRFTPNHENTTNSENGSEEEEGVSNTFENVKNRLLEWYSADYDDDISEWPNKKDDGQAYLDSGSRPLNVAMDRQREQNAQDKEVSENIEPGDRKSLSATLEMISGVENKDQRHKLIEAFKDIIKKRRNALLQAETKLTDEIVADPAKLDMSDDKILDQIQKESGLSSLAQEEVEEIKKTLFKIKKKRKEVAQVIKENNGIGEDVFEAVFGFAPKGEVDVEMGVANYRFYPNDQEDYVRALFGGDYPDFVTKKFFANLTLGSHDPKTSAVVLPEFESFASKIKTMAEQGDYRSGLLKHEEQHAINEILLETRLNEEMKIPENFSEFSQSDQEEFLSNNLREQAKAWTRTQLGEMLTRLREGDNVNTETAVEAAQSSMYNHLQGKYEPYFKKVLVEKGLDEKKAFTLVRNNFTKYGQRLIERGGEAIAHLSKKGYSNDEIVNLLQGNPFQDWKKTAERYAQEK